MDLCIYGFRVDGFRVYAFYGFRGLGFRVCLFFKCV